MGKMLETLSSVFVFTMTAYAAIGLAFGVPFVVWGVSRIDEEARGAGIGFRLLILPGVAAFWPFFAYRLARRVEEPPVERNPHRDRA